MLGDERTLLGQSMNRHINQKGYWYSLDSNLGAVVDDLNNAISSKDNFTCNENHNYSESKFYNYSELDLSFGDALTNFTKDTGITMSIVVEDCKDVFEKDYSKLIFSSLFIAGLAILAIFLFVQGIKSKRKKNKINDDEINEDKHESESNVIYDDGPLSNS